MQATYERLIEKIPDAAERDELLNLINEAATFTLGDEYGVVEWHLLDSLRQSTQE